MTLKTASQSLDPSVNRAALDGQNPAVKLQTLPNGLNSPLQNETALAFLTTRTANSKANVGNVGDNPNAKPDKILYHVFVKVPEGQKQATYEQLNRAVIKAVFNKNGIQLSRAALEEVSARLRLDYTPRYNYATGIYETNKKDGVMADVHDKEKGQYEFKVSERVENLILGEAKLAQEVTASGKKAFSEIRMDERLQMLMERTGKHLPKDAAEALKLIDPKALIAGMAIGAGVGSLVKRGLIASSAVVLVGGAMTMAQLLNYMGKAEHVLDTVQRAKTPQDLDAPAKELAELIKSGGVDLLLAAAGFGAGKIAPKVGKVAGQLTDDAARIIKQAETKANRAVDNYKERLEKLSESIIPEYEYAGVPKQSARTKDIKSEIVLEMRGKTTSGNRRFEETMRQKHLSERIMKVFSGDELTQAAKITNRPAADQIAFVQRGKNVEAVITETKQ